VSNTVHELSHGSDAPKTRSKFVQLITLVPFVVCAFNMNNPKVTISMWLLSAFIGFYFYINSNESKPGNEPKTGTPSIINAVYMLDRAQLLCMLRNAEMEKKKI
jgi:hypothetical protein